MAENSKIEWADHTFNPWMGCTKVSPACDHCYAEGWAKRSGIVQWGNAPRRRSTPANWAKPLKWNAEAGEKGIRYRVFCASLADVFDNQVPDQWRADLFELIEKTPHLDWLLLTKRIGNVAALVPQATDLIDYGEGWQSMWGQGVWPQNVWLGATIANQEEADRDIPKLLNIPARVRFLSCEPLLGRVDLCEIFGMWWNTTMQGWEGTGQKVNKGRFADGVGLHWVIAGGESGPGARPSHPDWFRSLRDQCQAAGVPFLFKQWGDHKIGEMDAAKVVLHWQDGTKQFWRDNEDIKYTGFWHGTSDRPYLAIPKRKAGRLLDGRTWDEFPVARQQESGQ